MINKTKAILFIILLSQLLLGEITGLEIMNQVRNNPIPASSITHFELTIIKKKKGRLKKKVREFVRYQKNYKFGKYNRKTLVRFSKPAIVKGTGLLNWSYRNGEQDQWFFLPKLKTAKKINSKDRSKTFMGTNFTYEDLESNAISNHTYKTLGIETLYGYPCHVIEAISSSSSIYKWKKYWIDMATFQIKKIEYYESGTSPIKVLTAQKHKLLEGYYIPESMVMTSSNGDQTTMAIRKAIMDAGIQDDIFTQKFLIRIK
ncbi:MAG: outer membrane lipoprotein-sorting protein [Candidatus Marinimicrobia bacterium]|nr:outer membrane lipoprotein-sorting protein [Candidatus Neomarinimicrobiota bacterium]MBT3936459.1 outer membrane lipoprotein-sorting protein [Candidatus Neomarinimicrobiota bacterium]MBT3962424.1 outer membrane lipoprotein-sorting protein [Candidatus Neomarinimicrobiota bacterium]MBT4383849.1 outer membrane lipoprotein-sorting protein [Candidatus Neomarinimicrobiota bacterium]MBT4636356.1 outer membrane lipoprotein-sorting protein [Candidatus Neomarinimicrobiota bacterium]